MSGLEIAASIGAATALAGTALGVTGAVQQGDAANAAAKAQAKQEQQAAMQADAIAQRDAAVKRQQANVQISRARAVAAASGAGADDPTVLDITSQLDTLGEYDVASALYEGKARSTALVNRAQATRWEGAQAQTAGGLRAGSTVLSGAATLADKYGSFVARKYG